MNHSTIVGGSTAKRVIACPASIELVAKMPPKPSSKYADEGTLLHDAISQILDCKATPESVIGMTYEGITLTQELYDDKIAVALSALDEIDPDKQMEFAVESSVNFGDLLPGVFGSADLLGRIGKKAIVLDWKFGNGVAVEATENEQGMFYAAAAMRTPETQWVFEDVEEIEIIIVQPPMVKRWVTTPERIKAFELELIAAVKGPRTKLESGEHCRWCAAKPTCPKVTGAVDRALKTALVRLDADKVSEYLAQADQLESWIDSVRVLAYDMLENNVKVPGYKLVAKRGTRQWVNDEAPVKLLGDKAYESKLISVAQAEKIIGKKNFPSDVAVSVSSGSTLAAESDPRPAVIDLGKQLANLKLI
ncbi:Protein of unknown function DUF2800 [uncultured Caudovirales phage]|uniref:DUF2800 domain-containing protein n=1 Tax=uncultured Caudovirales phage TaxID=2100421 RepID=A0A6J7WEQ6_9CAUD|nr:Protein of unknown function DUF2800 [uncultured Caudovirales phage]